MPLLVSQLRWELCIRLDQEPRLKNWGTKIVRLGRSFWEQNITYWSAGGLGYETGILKVPLNWSHVWVRQILLEVSKWSWLKLEESNA